PATIKTHAIIERTANFVCKQGAQFEIVLKAKQAGNSQFDFLRFDHYLNPYYKHILRAMKEGRYTPASENKQDQTRDTKTGNSNEEDDEDDDDDDDDGSYLHPSLFAPSKSSRLEEIIKPLQVMDPDHPLAALVRKAQQEKNGNVVITTKPEEEVVAQAPPAEYTTDPNMAAVYYGYCMLPDGTYCLAPPPPDIDASAYYSSMPAGMMPAHSASPAPPPPGTTPPPDSAVSVPSAPTAAAAPPAAPAPLSHVTPSGFYSTSSSTPQTSVSQPSSSSSSSSSSAAAIVPPPPDIQPVIDKLAEYVARNGEKFESSVRAKNDPRFDFLQSWHQYNTYYEFKKHYFMQKEASNLPQGSAVHKGDGTANCPSDKQSNEGKLIKASFAPICFAIKSKENDMLPLEKNRVRLDDDSDEDKGRGEEQEGAEQSAPGVEQQSEAPPPPPEEKKPTLSQEELEAKQAKQKLEDRLAAAAREKLAQASKEWKEKQLQAERKRKAALFLQTLRGPEVELKRTDESFAPVE
ncbi:splicing factor, suppressor of white-apricot, partial [Clarias magur]